LLIGGATTSRIHTAVKIDPHYSHGVIHVLDASKSVPVASNLLNDNPEEVNQFILSKKSEYEKLREDHALRQNNKALISLDEARKVRFQPDWNDYSIKTPSFLGTRVYKNFPVSELTEYIDWTPFFHAWEIKGRYPSVLSDSTYGKEARQLFEDANTLLDKIIKEKTIEAKGVLGFFPANSIGDDIEIYNFSDNKGLQQNRKKVEKVLHHLRQQNKKAKNLPNYCLADFIAPKEQNIEDYIGAFVVTAGFGVDQLTQKFESDHDDYNSIMVKAIADRLAEAFAERLHALVRTELWGYASEEKLPNELLIKEKYSGIRPAPGYPACPDHLEKTSLFELLDVESQIGVKLTESNAMFPAASVSGWYFSHPESRYFGINKIMRDQVEDYSERIGKDIGETEKWLGPILAYDI